jgi:hypothetical protein
MTSLNLLTNNTLDELYVTDLYTDTIQPNEDTTISVEGDMNFVVPPTIQSVPIQNYVRQQISVAGALTYNNATGRIDGITVDNTNRSVTLSLTGTTVLSADINAGTGQSLFLYLNRSQTAGNSNFALGISPSGAPETVVTISTTAGNDYLVGAFSISRADLNQNIIPSGIFETDIFASADHNDRAQLYTEIVYENSLGVETVLTTSTPVFITAITPLVDEFMLASVNPTQVAMDTTSYFTIKVYVRGVKSQDTVKVYFEGSTNYSYAQTTFNASAFLTNYYTKTETDTLLNAKQNGLTFNSPLVYTAGTGELGLNTTASSKWIYNPTTNAIANFNTTGTVEVLGDEFAVSSTITNFFNSVNLNNASLTIDNGNLVVKGGGGATFNGGVETSRLFVSGASIINSGLFVSGNMTLINDASGLAATIRGIDGITANYDLRGAFRALENTPTQSTTGGLEVPRVVASFQRAGRGGVVNSANVDFRLSSYEKATTQSRSQCDIHVHNGFSADAPTPVMSLRGNGNVGIGTTGPNSTLTVSGNMGLSGAMTISGTLNVSGSINITGSASFNLGISVSGNATFNRGLTITGGALNVIGISSVGDITLARNNSATVGKVLTFTFGTGNAGAQAQGIEFRDLTTPASNLGLYGYMNTLNFVAGGSSKMTIGANVDFATVPYISGSPIDTDDITDVGATNKYFTNALARGAISAVSPIVYNSTNGQISLASGTATQWTDDGTRLFPTNARRVRIGTSSSNSAILELLTPTNTHFIFNSQETGTSGCLIARTSNQAPILLADTATSNAQIGIGLGTGAVPDTNCIIHGKKTTGGIKAKIETGSASDAEIILKNSTGEFAWYSHNSVRSMRLYNYNTSADVFTILSTGNVGIGTTTPARPLDVNGTARVSTLQIQNSSLTTNGNDLFINSGTTSQIIHLRPNGDGSIVGQSRFHPTYTSFQGNAVFINLSGNVGIGNITPQCALDIYTDRTDGRGTIIQTNYSSPSIFSMNRLIMGQTGSTPSIQGEYLASGGGTWVNTGLVLNPNGGNVGIGRTTPTSALHIFTPNTTTPTVAQIFNNYGGLAGAEYSIAETRLGTSSYYGALRASIANATFGDAVRMDITTPQGSSNNTQVVRMSVMPFSGRVGINTISPQARLHVVERVRIEGVSGDTSAVLELRPFGRSTNFLFVNTSDVLVSTASFQTNGFVTCQLSIIAGFTAVQHNVANTLSTIISDIRTKKDVVPLSTQQTEELWETLEPVEYFFKIDESNPIDVRDPEQKTRRKHIGFIANNIHPRIQSIVKNYKHTPCERCIAYETHPKECQCEQPECSCSNHDCIGDTYNYIDRDMIGLTVAKVKIEEAKTKKLQKDYDVLYETMIKERVQYKVMEEKQNNKIKLLEKDMTAMKYQMGQLLSQLAFKGITIKM